jgi:hypothetical protein
MKYYILSQRQLEAVNEAMSEAQSFLEMFPDEEERMATVNAGLSATDGLHRLMPGALVNHYVDVGTNPIIRIVRSVRNDSK